MFLAAEGGFPKRIDFFLNEPRQIARPNYRLRDPMIKTTIVLVFFLVMAFSIQNCKKKIHKLMFSRTNSGLSQAHVFGGEKHQHQTNNTSS